MATPSMHICMDSSSDWLKGLFPEETLTPSSSAATYPTIPIHSPPLSVPLHERRARQGPPPPGQVPLKCPRCDSTHTKFCYYNNYSLSQPRYFCKTCRRYWTKGGSLRNVPVGGGCRKNKRHPPPPPPHSADKKPSNHHPHHAHAAAAFGLHLSFSPPLPTTITACHNNFFNHKYNSFLDSQFYTYDNNSSNGGGGNRVLMEDPGNIIGETKPTTAETRDLPSLEWQEQCCADIVGRETPFAGLGLRGTAGMIGGGYRGRSPAL